MASIGEMEIGQTLRLEESQTEPLRKYVLELPYKNMYAH